MKIKILLFSFLLFTMALPAARRRSFVAPRQQTDIEQKYEEEFKEKGAFAHLL